MNFSSPTRRCWKHLFEPQVILWEGPATVNPDTNTGLIIQADATYVRTHIGTVGKHSNVRGIDTVASHKW